MLHQRCISFTKKVTVHGHIVTVPQPRREVVNKINFPLIPEKFSKVSFQMFGDILQPVTFQKELPCFRFNKELFLKEGAVINHSCKKVKKRFTTKKDCV